MQNFFQFFDRYGKVVPLADQWPKTVRPTNPGTFELTGLLERGSTTNARLEKQSEISRSKVSSSSVGSQCRLNSALAKSFPSSSHGSCSPLQSLTRNLLVF